MGRRTGGRIGDGWVGGWVDACCAKEVEDAGQPVRMTSVGRRAGWRVDVMCLTNTRKYIRRSWLPVPMNVSGGQLCG